MGPIVSIMGKRRKRRRNGGSRKRQKAMPVVIMKRKRHVGSAKRLIPKKIVRTLIYSDVVSLDVGAIGDVVYHNFNAAGVFDPDRSGGGHQPMGFDQLMPLYNQYRVLHCGMTATFSFDASVDPTLIPAAIGVVGIKVSDNAGSLPLKLNALVEQRRARYKYLNYPTGSNSIKTVKYGVVPHKFAGLQWQAAELIGDATQDPPLVINISVFASPNDEVTNIPNIWAQVRIHYKVEFSHPETELAQS